MRSRSTDPDATLHPLPGDHSVVAPPVPIPNTEVKRNRADGSVHKHARVGHRQGLYPKPQPFGWGFLLSVRGPDANEWMQSGVKIRGQ